MSPIFCLIFSAFKPNNSNIVLLIIINSFFLSKDSFKSWKELNIFCSHLMLHITLDTLVNFLLNSSLFILLSMNNSL